MEAELFLRWVEQEGEVAKLMPDLLPDYVRALIAERRNQTSTEAES